MERHIAGTNPATELGIDVIPSSIDPSPDPPNAELPYLGPDNLDVPGPSSTFIPRQPSPPLPDLRSRPFPPNEHSDSEDEDDEDDDEIIAQLPIYLSPALFPNLDLYQYPLQLKSLNAPKWAQERGKAISARVKENAGPVEIEVPVDEDPYYWRDEQARTMGFIPDVHANGDDEQAANFGFAAKADDKKKKKKPEIKREKWGEKRRLRGDLVPSATGYYSGVIHDGALHLHPVSKTLQFRPSLGYLDDLDAVEASKRSRDDGEGGKRKSKRDAPPRPKLHDDEDNDGTGSIRDFRNKMWATAQKEEEDVWVPYTWLSGDDPAVLEKIDALLVPEDKQYRLDSTTQGLDYLNKVQ